MGESSIRSNWQSTRKDQERWSRSNSSDTDVDESDMVADDLGVDDLSTDSSSEQGGSVSPRLLRESTPVVKPQLESDRLAFIRKSEKYRNVHPEVAEVAIRGGLRKTLNRYQSGWKMFAQWWNSQGFENEKVIPDQISHFLMTKAKSVAYSTLAGYRSAISATLDEVNGAKMGEHWLVRQTMKELKAEKPTKPKYTETWDADLLLDWMERTNTADLDTRGVRNLLIVMLKLYGLMRSSDVERILSDSIQFKEDYVVGLFSQRKAGQLEWRLDRNDAHPNLCAWRMLKRYMGMKKPNGEHLFGIQADTIANITNNALHDAGIPDKFKAHSTRMAGASKALDLGMSVDDVMRIGGWTTRAVFELFYNRARAKDLGRLLTSGGNRRGSLHVGSG
eukprot:TRINITY_DN6002_c0_g1_i4.p1 TRINITY_DN6002_c0_g1~~TRINITY_DN6002_c0_g1_i4.p1  ORF type:complete len:431 (-),score=68.10 TRINITY_DN6002_c0_g1_i4:213-1385(-)